MPLYRTPEDLRQERRTHDLFAPMAARVFGRDDLAQCSYHGRKLLPYDGLGRAADPHVVVAAWEIKRRYKCCPPWIIPPDRVTRRYATYRIECSKCFALAQFCGVKRPPALAAIIVQLDHDAGLVPLHAVLACPVLEFGRVDRGRQETGKSFDVPWSEFYWLGISGQDPRGPVNSSYWMQFFKSREQGSTASSAPE